MSHELRDNKERRDEIVLAFRKSGPLHPQKAMTLIMAGWGYNKRGAREKLDEMLFLGMLEKKEGKIHVPKID
jgi:hypothetical protein